MRLLIFNPWNDFALANGDPNFCIPASSVKMAHDLAPIQSLWSEPGDIIFNPQRGLSCDEADKVQEVIPWGWSPLLKKLLLKAGITEEILPDDETIKKLREISHRRSSIAFLKLLEDSVEYDFDIPPTPVEFSDSTKASDFFDINPKTLFKLPWSSSGKGIFWCERMDKIERDKRVISSIRRMGSIIAEHRFDKVVDFAMLFESDGLGKIVFKGYSLFNTDSKGSYQSNLLASNDDIEEELCQYTNLRQLNILKLNIIKLLPNVIKYYNGMFCIDMMIYKENDRYFLHPCVEINLRNSMGQIARQYFDKFMKMGKGSFHVSSDRNMCRYIDDLRDKSKGDEIICLTPVYMNTEYCIYADIEK